MRRLRRALLAQTHVHRDGFSTALLTDSHEVAGLLLGKLLGAGNGYVVVKSTSDFAKAETCVLKSSSSEKAAWSLVVIFVDKSY